MKKVVVTGATGFLGSHLVAELVRSGCEVHAVCRKVPEKIPGSQVNFYSGDIEDPYSLKEIFFKADVVVHAAALVSADPADDQRMYEVNVQGTRNVVDACLFCGVGRLVYVSSVAALGNVKGINSIDEQTSWNGPESGYGFTKYRAGLEVFRGEAEGLEIAVVHPSVILGPGNAERSSGKILQLIRSGVPFVPEGTVNAVDARDVAQIIVRLAEGSGTGQSYILNGFSMPWIDLFTRLARGYGRSGKFLIVSGMVAAGLVWVYEKLCRMVGIRPALTVNAIHMACRNNSYDSQKAIRQLDFEFRSGDQTIEWIISGENPQFSQIKQG